MMETLWQMEANIDDMNPQNMEYIFRCLLDLGVNDVWAMPMLMKKCRMASMLCVLCREDLLEKAADIIFKETTSVGVRYFPVSRIACRRSIQTVTVSGETLHCKICWSGDAVTNISAEYDDCRAAAVKTGIPLKEWQRRVLEAAWQCYGGKKYEETAI